MIRSEKLLENYYWIGLTTAVTFYALFADDLRILLLPKSADTACDVITIICMAIYLFELVLGSIVIEGYVFGFYFWVDLISLLSMVPDITFIMNEVEGGIGGAGEGAEIAKTGRASRVIKIIRIIRLIRLLRVVKLYKQVRAGERLKNSKIQEERESKRIARKKGNTLAVSGKDQYSNFANLMHHSRDSFDDELDRVDRDH